MRLVERGIVVDQAGPDAQPLPRRSELPPRRRHGRQHRGDQALLGRRRPRPARVRGRAQRGRQGGAADLRHDRARPADQGPRRPPHDGDDGPAGGQEPQAPQRAHPAVHVERRPGARRAVRERARPGRARLARDQRQRRRARQLPAPRSSSCTTTRATPATPASGSGASCAAAWASSPSGWPTLRARRARWSAATPRSSRS